MIKPQKILPVALKRDEIEPINAKNLSSLINVCPNSFIGKKLLNILKIIFKKLFYFVTL